MNSMRIPFHLPSMGPGEEKAAVDVIRSGWLTTGEQARVFEQKFAEYVGVKHALAVNSATSALHLALDAFGIGEGDRVIVPTMTFTATAEVVRYMGAEPVMVDSEPITLNLDVKKLESLLQKGGIKAIIPVHYAGLPCDMDVLHEMSVRYGVDIIEDAAHSFPTRYRGRMIGSKTRATAFSFYVTKTLATGEGGMLVTDDDAVAARARVMRLHGINRDAFDRYRSDTPSWYYEVVAPGFKYNLTDLASAIGLVQLSRAEEMRARREAIATRYSAGLQGLPLTLPQVATNGDMHAWHLYVVRLIPSKVQIDRDQLIAMLAKRGIATSVHFIPLHRHPYWRDHCALRAADFPVAEAAYQQMLSLPIYPDMTDEQVEYVIANFRECLNC